MGNNNSSNDLSGTSKVLQDDFTKFKAELKLKKFYDIEKGKAVVLTETNKPLCTPSGTLASPSDQGSTETCAGHSVGKAITEILDTYGFDTRRCCPRLYQESSTG